MNDSEFIILADETLRQIELALESCEADLDFSSTGTGILEIEFDDGDKIVINRHGVNQEIWVAARVGGFHFRWDGQAWRETKNGSELMVILSKLIFE